MARASDEASRLLYLHLRDTHPKEKTVPLCQLRRKFQSPKAYSPRRFPGLYILNYDGSNPSRLDDVRPQTLSSQKASCILCLQPFERNGLTHCRRVCGILNSDGSNPSRLDDVRPQTLSSQKASCILCLQPFERNGLTHCRRVCGILNSPL